MLTHANVEEQYEQASSDDIRILIVGAGIAGVTAAALLRHDGRHPVVIDRAKDDEHAGYMLALMPLVDAALDDLGVHERYRESSVALERYGLHASNGRMLRNDSMVDILARFGEYRGISRGELIDVLTPEGCAVAFGSVVTALDDSGTASTVTIESCGNSGSGSGARSDSTRRQLEFDLVIVADGIHSSTRALVLGDRALADSAVGIVDTKWGGWVVWAPEDTESDLGEELWGARSFLGIYPVLGKVGVFLGGPNSDTQAGPAAFAEDMRRSVTTLSPRLERALDAVARDPDPYYWPLTDCRSPAWAIGRTVLLGDAAAGFLPTAGIGAGMAMESAWVLTRMLRHATAGDVAPDITAVLLAYERTQRPRVEAAQGNSRGLARVMFRRSLVLAKLRDVAMRIVSVKLALGPIQKLLAEQPDPDAAAEVLVAHSR
jgi:2-polyprenyl-6-methoxyphenol hydroxylase-like FAD-dependent oxidoreductase